MSILRVNQIRSKLKTLFESHLYLNDIKQDDLERENKVLSRCLAAFAVYYSTGCSAEEAAKAVIDGGDDNGIDAVFHDAAAKMVICVQSKWINKGSGEPEAKEIGSFLSGVRDLIELDISGFHKRLHDQLDEIKGRLETPGTSVAIVLITTGASKLAIHGQTLINKFLIELNGEEADPIASSTVLGLAEVYKGLANDSRSTPLTLDLTLQDWAHVSEPFSAYYGTVDGDQLKNWWLVHGKLLLAANIRHSLGETDVNTEIRKTAISSPERFWYFNNGVTLIANEIAKAPANTASRAVGVFSLIGASVVNGAQTISSLGKITEIADIAKVKVPLRVISLQSAPDDFGKEVTRSNNLQNRVEARDFVAHDTEQERLKQEMAMEGVEYHYLRGDDESLSGKTCGLIEVTTALACASGDSNLAVQVKTGVGRFFNDLDKAPYKTVFNPSTTGAYAFNATVMLRRIDLWLKTRIATLDKKSGPIYGTLVHGNRILAAVTFERYGTSLLKCPITQFQTELDIPKLEEICEDVHVKMHSATQSFFPGKFLAVLFKSPSNSKRIFDCSLK